MNQDQIDAAFSAWLNEPQGPHTAKEWNEQRLKLAFEAGVNAALPEGLANKGPTPRTDGVLPSQSFIDETRLFDRHYYLPLIDLARQLERELAEAKFRPIGDNHHNAVLCPYCNPLVNGSAAVSPRLGCEHVWHAGDQGCRKCGAPQP